MSTRIGFVRATMVHEGDVYNYTVGQGGVKSIALKQTDELSAVRPTRAKWREPHYSVIIEAEFAGVPITIVFDADDISTLETGPLPA